MFLGTVKENLREHHQSVIPNTTNNKLNEAMTACILTGPISPSSQKINPTNHGLLKNPKIMKPKPIFLTKEGANRMQEFLKGKENDLFIAGGTQHLLPTDKLIESAAIQADHRRLTQWQLPNHIFIILSWEYIQ